MSICAGSDSPLSGLHSENTIDRFLLIFCFIAAV